MIGRADIEGSKSDVAMNAWPPQASYPCGNFSDTSCSKLLKPKGSIGPAFAVRIRTENQDQASICPFALREVSVLTELALGHLRYLLTDVPPQSNSPPEAVLGGDRTAVDKPQGLCPPRILDSRNVEPIDSAFHLT